MLGPLHLAGHRAGHGRAVPGLARGRGEPAPESERARADRRLRAPRGGPGERLLDLGCGGGRHAFQAVRRGARVVALDAGSGRGDPGARHHRRHGRRRRGAAKDDEAGCRPGRRPAPSLRRRQLRPGHRRRGARAHPRRHARPWPSCPGCCGPAARWPSPCPGSDPRSSTGPCQRIPRRPRRPRAHLPPVDAAWSACAAVGLRPFASHHAHALHSPYWWLRCLVGPKRDDHPAVRAYHRLLVWDIMRAPRAHPDRRARLNPCSARASSSIWRSRHDHEPIPWCPSPAWRVPARGGAARSDVVAMPEIAGVLSRAEVAATAASIAEVQLRRRDDPVVRGRPLRPVEPRRAAMALTVAGFHKEALAGLPVAGRRPAPRRLVVQLLPGRQRREGPPPRHQRVRLRRHRGLAPLPGDR